MLWSYNNLIVANIIRNLLVKKINMQQTRM